MPARGRGRGRGPDVWALNIHSPFQFVERESTEDFETRTKVAQHTGTCCNVLIGGIKASANRRYLIIRPRKNVFIDGRRRFHRSLFAAYFAHVDTFPGNPKCSAQQLIASNKLKCPFRCSFAVHLAVSHISPVRIN